MVKKLTFLLCLTLAVGLVGSTAALGAASTCGSVPAAMMPKSTSPPLWTLGAATWKYPTRIPGRPAPPMSSSPACGTTSPFAKGAKITKAYVEFTCDETKGGTNPVNLIIEGQLAVNPPAFTTAAKNLTSRAPWTTAQVAWTVENWTTVGQKSQTPDITAYSPGDHQPGRLGEWQCPGPSIPRRQEQALHGHSLCRCL